VVCPVGTGVDCIEDCKALKWAFIRLVSVKINCPVIISGRSSAAARGSGGRLVWICGSCGFCGTLGISGMVRVSMGIPSPQGIFRHNLLISLSHSSITPPQSYFMANSLEALPYLSTSSVL